MIIKAKSNVKKNLRNDLKYLNVINFAYFADFTKKKGSHEMFTRNFKKTSDVCFS